MRWRSAKGGIEVGSNSVIFIAGAPASGKTEIANHLAAEFQLPLFCKDAVKERIWERMRYDTENQAEASTYTTLLYDVSFYFVEELMRVGVPFIFESNFTTATGEVLTRLVDVYQYRAVTVLCTADVEVLYARFISRDAAGGRHPGLVTKRRYDDLAHFARDTESMRNFSVGNRIVVDTTNFVAVDYAAITEKIRKLL